MIQESQDLLATLDRLTRTLVDTLAAAPVAALDWNQGPETNSAAAIVTHALGATRNWIVTYVGGSAIDRNRAAEFQAASADIGDFQARALRWLDEARRALEPLTTADLDRPANIPDATRQTFPGLTVRGAALHAIEHLGLHIGHLELTLQLWHLQVGESAG